MTSFPINHIQAMAEWLHNCSFNFEDVVDFLLNVPLTSVCYQTILCRVKSCSVRVIVAFVCRPAVLHAKTSAAESPFTATSVINSSAIALVHYCSDENLEHL